MHPADCADLSLVWHKEFVAADCLVLIVRIRQLFGSSEMSSEIMCLDMQSRAAVLSRVDGSKLWMWCGECAALKTVMCLELRYVNALTEF